MRIFLLLSLFFVPQLFWGQESPSAVLNGKILADLSDKSTIYIINQSTDGTATSDKRGYFKIAASAGDTLMFTSTEIIGERVALTADDFKSNFFIVHLEVLVNQLDEVIIVRNKNITAESLGIVPKGQKKFTPAERKLNTASNPYATVGLGAAASLDPVLNWLSGRTAMLKKEVAVEKKEGWLAVLYNSYDEGHVVENLKIPAEHVDGFFRYCIAKEYILHTLGANNKTMLSFQLGELAVEYNKIIQIENP